MRRRLPAMTPRRLEQLPPGVAACLERQEGVITRRQVLDDDGDSALVRRRLRGGDWIRKYPGVYLTHTGPASWMQRAWLGVLGAAPAVLCHRSAVAAAGGTVDGIRFDDGPIHVAVDVHRNLSEHPKPPDDERVVVHYVANLQGQALWDTHPPRIRPEYAVLDVAGRARTDHRAIARLAESVQAGITTAARLLEVLEARHNYRRQHFLAAVLADIRDGTHSVLEHRYLTDVERAHGLPTAARQARTTVGRKGRRDADYQEFGVIVELDGRLGHDDATARDRDLERDLDALVGAAKVTARIGSGQVFDRACVTAEKVARLLAKGGWTGTPTRCSRKCPLTWTPPG